MTHTTQAPIQGTACSRSWLILALILLLVAIDVQATPTTSANRLNNTENEQRGLMSKDLASTESSILKPFHMYNKFSTFTHWIQVTHLLISLFGIIGNLIVILLIVKFTREQTVTDILILNLASADLMFVTGIIINVITINRKVWMFGNVMCKIFFSSTFLNMFASSLLLVVMSFDRYLLVCHPIYAQKFRQPGRARTVCWCVWLVCFVLQTPVLIVARSTVINGVVLCTGFSPAHNTDYERAFTWYSFPIGFLFPMLLISGFYIQVVRRLRQSSNRPNLPVSSRRVRSTKRIARLIIVLIFTYVICWLPYWLYRLTYHLLVADVKFFLKFIASSLVYTNSALNPILYAFLSDNFTRRFSRMVKSICRANLFGRSPQSQTNITSRLAPKTDGQAAQQNVNVKLEIP